MSYIKKAQEQRYSVPELVTELLDASSKTHILHLRVRGDASYAQHKALNELYDALPGLADGIAESYQGATGEIPQYAFVACPELNTVNDCMSYIVKLRDKITKVQDNLPYSEIVNDLDLIKTQLNSTYYKLKFLA